MSLLPRMTTLCAAALLSAAGAAQSRPQLIGFAGTPAAVNGILITQDWTTCSITQCGPAMPASPGRFAGGTAYDATRGGVWVSDGTMIGVFHPESCATLCPPTPAPLLSTRSVVTGLAVNERVRTLVMTDSLNNIYQFALRCPLSVSTPPCNVSGALPPGHVIGGVATDDLRDLVLFAASDHNPMNPPMNSLYIARRMDACTPFCRVRVPDCGPNPLGAITGVAYDPCREVVWCTDGRQTVGLRLDLTACTVTEVQCCRLPANASYVGLCVKPSRAESVGRSCSVAVCPACPTLFHSTVGDAALGNPSFQLLLEDAPAQTRAFLAIGLGGCTPGLAIPPFCGRFHVPFAPIAPNVFGPFATGGTVGCTGSASATLGIPANAALCGLTLSSQWFGLCQSPVGLGTFVSNCQSWTISGT